MGIGNGFIYVKRHSTSLIKLRLHALDNITAGVSQPSIVHHDAHQGISLNAASTNYAASESTLYVALSGKAVSPRPFLSTGLLPCFAPSIFVHDGIQAFLQIVDKT